MNAVSKLLSQLKILDAGCYLLASSRGDSFVSCFSAVERTAADDAVPLPVLLQQCSMSCAITYDLYSGHEERGQTDMSAIPFVVPQSLQSDGVPRVPHTFAPAMHSSTSCTNKQFVGGTKGSMRDLVSDGCENYYWRQDRWQTRTQGTKPARGRGSGHVFVGSELSGVSRRSKGIAEQPSTRTCPLKLSWDTPQPVQSIPEEDYKKMLEEEL